MNFYAGDWVARLNEATIPAMSEETIETVRRLERHLLELPQVELVTNHVIHAGMYARTIIMPAGCVVSGALIKIATMVIISGHASFYVDGETVEFEGYHVVPASAGRKQAVFAHGETHITMMFPTDAKTVDEAEARFTDEADMLGAHRDVNTVTITGQ